MAEVLVVGGGPVGLMTALGVGESRREGDGDRSGGKHRVFAPRHLYAWTMLPALRNTSDCWMTCLPRAHRDGPSFRIFKTGENIVPNTTTMPRPALPIAYSLTLGQDMLRKLC